MSQTVSQNHAYLIRRNGIYYFSRRVPSDLQTRFNKERVTISLRTRSFTKAEKSAEALSDRLERYWDGLRLEVFHTKELGPNRHSIPMVTLSFVSMNNTPSIGYYHTIKRSLHRGRCNQGATTNIRGPRAGNRGPGFLGLVRSSVLLVLTDWQDQVWKNLIF